MTQYSVVLTEPPMSNQQALNCPEKYLYKKKVSSENPIFTFIQNRLRCEKYSEESLVGSLSRLRKVMEDNKIIHVFGLSPLHCSKVLK